MTTVIIGGGAAGIMTAATLLEQQPKANIILIEKNAILGRKILLSGGGRCNLTTGIQDIKLLLTKYPRGHKFLRIAMYNFSPPQVQDWFVQHGIPLKTQPDLRVFPQSNNGQDIVNVFTKIFSEHKNMQVMLQQTVKTIIKKNNVFSIILSSGKNISADKVVLAVGGQAYRQTGSTGDGYYFAEQLGHTITPLAPSLNAFLVKEAWVKQLAGVSLPEIILQVPNNKKYQAIGPVVFTHQGMSGPVVFALSAQIAFEHYNHNAPLTITLDFVPSLNIAQLTNQLNVLINTQPKQLLRNTLHGWLPKSLVFELLQNLHISLEQINATVNKTMRMKIVQWLKQCPVQIIGRAAGEEFVTAGGVDTNEVNPRTMESKLCPGLFFAGEILNIDGFTGGFNLQAAWATSRLAGLTCALK
ncbi:MAG: NAD(P)/FAD-dependent oxidoreductase [Patescibacteria group bacterium]|jgi:hypothetical protein